MHTHHNPKAQPAMESVEQHQAATLPSGSPSHPIDVVSPPLSPDSAANARWTPTKEQVGVLEGLYRQGMRTPTAEQIQQVTASLQRHGPIEGKNVFYWFQNHKARQRQRQKQQAFDYFARHFRRPEPLPVLHRPAAHPFLPPIPLHPPPHHMPSSSSSTAPDPPARTRQAQAMYMQQQQQQPCNMTVAATANASYYMQTQTPMVYPREAHEKVPAQAPAAMYYQEAAPNNAGTLQPHSPPATGSSRRHPETLNLFPLHPTFALPKKTRRADTAASATPMAPSSSASSSLSLEPESPSGAASLPLYDFFGVGR